MTKAGVTGMSDLLERIDQAIDQMADDMSLSVMMVIAAPTIAGRPCIIRRKAPGSKDAYGSTTVRPDGLPVIRIDPDLGKDTVKIYLHELAHIRLGHVDQVRRTNLHLAAPRSIPADANPSIREWENQVDDQVNEWLRYGRKHADPGDQLGIIQALYKHYKKPNKRG